MGGAAEAGLRRQEGQVERVRQQRVHESGRAVREGRVGDARSESWSSWRRCTGRTELKQEEKERTGAKRRQTTPNQAVDEEKKDGESTASVAQTSVSGW